MIGILGGTFDPIHFGHLRLAQEMAAQLGLTQIRVIPSAQPPHRDMPAASVEHRIAMSKLAIADNPLLTLDLREAERSGPSYMVDTLTSLRAEIGNDVPLFLLLGADAFLGLPGWHRWHELFGLAHIAVAHRPGYALANAMSAELSTEWSARHAEQATGAYGNIVTCEITALDISASAIRSMITNKTSPRYLLPDAELDYITQHQLYIKP